MLIRTQTIWLEQTEESIKEIKQAEELALPKTPIPEPVYVVLSEDVFIDLTQVVAVKIDPISIGETEYILPKLIFQSGETQTINEQFETTLELVLRAKNLTEVTQIAVPRPIQ